MRKPRTAFLGILLAVGASCSQDSLPPSGDAAGTLVVTAADPSHSLEARYSEAGRTIVLRSGLSATGPAAEILDETGRSLTALAAAASARFTSDRRSGEKPEASRLVVEADQLAAAALLSRHALRHLDETLPSETRSSPLYGQLQRQLGALRLALKTTRLELLQRWEDDAARSIEMSPEERSRFFAIFQRHALMIGKQVKPTPAADELTTLLGPERYAQYVARRNRWWAPAKARVEEVLP